MTTIDRHEVHQLLCMGLAHSAQYGRAGVLLRLLMSLPGNGTRVRALQWIERFSPYRFQCDQDRHPISLITERDGRFDPAGAAATPYWKLPDRAL